MSFLQGDTDIPEEFSHLSMGDIHYHDKPAFITEIIDETTVPLPQSPQSQSQHSQSHFGGNSGTPPIVKEILPQVPLFITTGIPLLKHYVLGNGEVNRNLRFVVPTASKSACIKGDEALSERKTQFLLVLAECFPSYARRYGQTSYITNHVYDFFTGIEKKAEDTITGIQI